MNIRDMMRTNPLTIGETDPLAIAQRWMKKYSIRHLPVVAGDKLVGMLSERDLLVARSKAFGDRWWRLKVRDVMEISPQTVYPDDSLTEVAARMAQSKLDAFPVVERGKLLGLVTVIDVLDAEVQLAMASHELEGEAPESRV